MHNATVESNAELASQHVILKCILALSVMERSTSGVDNVRNNSRAEEMLSPLLKDSQPEAERKVPHKDSALRLRLHQSNNLDTSARFDAN